VLRVPEGSLALLAAVRTGGPPNELAAGVEAALVFAAGAGDEVTVEALEPALAALLERAARSATEAELLAEARRHGADPGEDAEIVAGLVGDGLLVRTSDR
jgi:hypothetical protein